MAEVFYVSEPDTWVVRRAGNDKSDSGSRQLLLGQRLHVDVATQNAGWVSAQTVVLLQTLT